MVRWTPEQLIDQLLQSRLDDEVLIRSAEDAVFGRMVDRLREMVEGLSSLRAAEPSADVVRRAQGLMPRGGWVRQAIQAIRAALALDSASPAFAGVRSQSATPAADRYLRFEAPDHAAELHVLPTDLGHYDVEGRLLAPQGQAPFAVIAHDAIGRSIPAISDEMGHFHFPNLPSGQYELHLELDDADLFLSPFVLSEPESPQPRSAS
jgi:hypothetical protein